MTRFDPMGVGWRLGRSHAPRGKALWVPLDRTTGVYGAQGCGKTLDRPHLRVAETGTSAAAGSGGAATAGGSAAAAAVVAPVVAGATTVAALKKAANAAAANGAGRPAPPPPPTSPPPTSPVQHWPRSQKPS